MSTPLRVASFLTALVGAFAVAWGAGQAVGPIDTEPVAAHEDTAHGDGAGHGDEAGHGDQHGAATVLTTRIELDGEPVTDLEPYLGAFGHLVAIRAGDLGYLHVHPEGEPGPAIEFATAFPEPATYGLFLDFQHRGTVRTAAFTVESSGAPSGDHAEGGEHEH